MKKLIFIILFILGTLTAVAQENCDQNLTEAKADYNNGNLYAIPGKLTECLENGFSKSEKVDAYKLLTLTYLNINQLEKARETLIKLLNIKTDFQVIQNVDPPELYSLYRKIDTDPIYFIGINVGINYNTTQILKAYTTETVEGSLKFNYKPLFSYQAGGRFILPLLDKLWLKAEVSFQNQRFEYLEETNNPKDTSTIDITYFSNNRGVNLNFSSRSIINNYKWKPFVEYGITGRYNLNTIFSEYLGENSKSVNFTTIERIEMNEFRSNYNVGLDLSVGSMIKLGEHYGEIKFGATKYLLNHATYSNDSERFSNTIGNAGETNDHDFNNLIYQLTLSYNVPFFNFK